MQEQMMSQNEQDIERFLKVRMANDFSPATIENQRFILNKFNEYLRGKPFRGTTEQDVMSFLIQDFVQAG